MLPINLSDPTILCVQHNIQHIKHTWVAFAISAQQLGYIVAIYLFKYPPPP